MRAVIAASLLALMTPAVACADAPLFRSALLDPIPDGKAEIGFTYDIESLSGLFELGFDAGRIEVSVGNVFELPEYEPAAGFYLDEHTLLSVATSGIEVDTGVERSIALSISFRW